MTAMPTTHTVLCTLILALLLLSSAHAFAALPSTSSPSFLTQHTSRSQLFSSSAIQSSPSVSRLVQDKVRLLGAAPNLSSAIVPGSVLLAPPSSYNHFLRHAAIFVLEVGVPGTDNPNEKVVKGVLIDQPTAFSIGETLPEHFFAGYKAAQPDPEDAPSSSLSSSTSSSSSSPSANPEPPPKLSLNTLFTGGDVGGSSVTSLHTNSLLRSTKSRRGGEEIGTSGVFLAPPLHFATLLVEEEVFDSGSFKFFFNCLEFSASEIQGMDDAGKSSRQPADLSDCWLCVEAPKDLVVCNEVERGQAWKACRDEIFRTGQRPTAATSAAGYSATTGGVAR